MEIDKQLREQLIDSYVNVILNLLGIDQDDKLQIAMSELSFQMESLGIIEDVLAKVDEICLDNSISHPVTELQ